MPLTTFQEERTFVELGKEVNPKIYILVQNDVRESGSRGEPRVAASATLGSEINGLRNRNYSASYRRRQGRGL